MHGKLSPKVLAERVILMLKIALDLLPLVPVKSLW